LSFLCKPAGKGKSNNDVATPSHKQMHWIIILLSYFYYFFDFLL
jgi:hypothetical protein